MFTKTSLALNLPWTSKQVFCRLVNMSQGVLLFVIIILTSYLKNLVKISLKLQEATKLLHHSSFAKQHEVKVFPGKLDN